MYFLIGEKKSSCLQPHPLGFSTLTNYNLQTTNQKPETISPLSSLPCYMPATPIARWPFPSLRNECIKKVLSLYPSLHDNPPTAHCYLPTSTHSSYHDTDEFEIEIEKKTLFPTSCGREQASSLGHMRHMGASLILPLIFVTPSPLHSFIHSFLTTCYV